MCLVKVSLEQPSGVRAAEPRFQRSSASRLLPSGLALGMLLRISAFNVIVCKLGVIMLPAP